MAQIVKLPEFYAHDPRAWFKQVEAVFTIKNVTNEPTKKAHLIAGIVPALAKAMGLTCTTTQTPTSS